MTFCIYGDMNANRNLKKNKRKRVSGLSSL